MSTINSILERLVREFTNMLEVPSLDKQVPPRSYIMVNGFKRPIFAVQYLHKEMPVMLITGRHAPMSEHAPMNAKLATETDLQYIDTVVETLIRGSCGFDYQHLSNTFNLDEFRDGLNNALRQFIDKFSTDDRPFKIREVYYGNRIHKMYVQFSFGMDFIFTVQFDLYGADGQWY